MMRTSWVEICVSDFEQSINWFENVLGFRVVARDENEYAELRQGEGKALVLILNSFLLATQSPIKLASPRTENSSVHFNSVSF